MVKGDEIKIYPKPEYENGFSVIYKFNLQKDVYTLYQDYDIDKDHFYATLIEDGKPVLRAFYKGFYDVTLVKKG